MKPGGFPPVSILSEHAKEHSFGNGAFTRSGDHHTSGVRYFGSTGNS